jgi:hypothetical protein
MPGWWELIACTACSSCISGVAGVVPLPRRCALLMSQHGVRTRAERTGGMRHSLHCTVVRPRLGRLLAVQHVLVHASQLRLPSYLAKIGAGSLPII